MLNRNSYFRGSLQKLISEKLQLITLSLLFTLVLINLFIIKYAFTQSTILSGEVLEAHDSLAEEKATFSWSTALDELKIITDLNERKNILTKQMSELFIEAIKHESIGARGLSETEKKKISHDLEKIYFESIYKMRTGLANKDDFDQLEEKIRDYLVFSNSNSSLGRINQVIHMISQIQSADNQYEENTFMKSLRRQLKTLLQQTLDEKGAESEEFKLYQELLNSHPRTKLILDHNNKEALSNKFQKAQEDYDENRELRRFDKKTLEYKIQAMTKDNKPVNSLEKDPLFEKLEKFDNLTKLTPNLNNYLRLKTKLHSLESRLNSNFEYSFKKSHSDPSQSQISKDKCNEISFNNISNMGADSNQKYTSTCWAHASAALIEEQLCLAHPEHCGKRVSRTYIIGKTRGIDFFGNGMLEGASPLSVLTYFTSPSGRDFNICLDSYSRNPLNFEEFNYPQYLLQEYSLIKMKQTNVDCFDQLEKNVKESIRQWGNLLDFLKDDEISPSRPKHYLSREIFKQLVAESASAEEFVQKVLLSSCAQANQQVNFRRNPEQHLVSIDFFENQNMQDFVDVFKDAKSYHHSILLNICFNPFEGAIRRLEKRSMSSSADACNAHALVTNAIRWNSVKNYCEVHLKNSHGQYSSIPSGWYPAEVTFQNTKHAIYFGSD